DPPRESALLEPVAAAFELHRAQRDERDRGCPLVVTKPPGGLHATDVRQLEVHEDDVGAVLHRDRDRVDACRCFQRVEACGAEHVACELAVALIVVDYKRNGHRRILAQCRSAWCSQRTSTSCGRACAACSSPGPTSKSRPCAVISTRCSPPWR